LYVFGVKEKQGKSKLLVPINYAIFDDSIY